MAVTISIKKRSKNLSLYQVVADITYDASYPTGGEALTPADFGLHSLDLVIATPADGYVSEYDYTNEKLLAYDTPNTGAGGAAALSEVEDTTDLSTVTTRVLAVGT